MGHYLKVGHQPRSEELGLPPDREFVWGGFFLAWLARNELLSAEFVALVGVEQVTAVKERRLSGPQLLQHVDGVIDREMVAPAARQLCSNYLDLMNGALYLADFRQAFGIRGKMPADLYVVEDAWENYDRIAGRIDRAWQVASA